VDSALRLQTARKVGEQIPQPDHVLGRHRKPSKCEDEKVVVDMAGDRVVQSAGPNAVTGDSQWHSGRFLVHCPFAPQPAGVAACMEGGPHRDAYRRAAIAARKPGTTRRKAVEVGRLDQRMSVAAEHLRIVPVGHQGEGILRSHAASSTMDSLQRHYIAI
jgi:hypothetical protein